MTPGSLAAGLSFPEFVWIWNRGQGLTTPRLHITIATWLAERWTNGDRAMLLLAFRNSGKSTLVGLFCAWLLFRNPNLRILVVAADHALARKMVRNVKRVVERHAFTAALVPRVRDSWAADQFTVVRSGEFRDPSMIAKGIGANITGLRADVVICDDVEVPNTCNTESKRADLRVRLNEIDYILVPGGTQLYIGTPHTYYSIYADDVRPELDEARPFLDGFHRMTIPLVDGDGRSRWPERFPDAAIDQIRARTGPHKFESQMLLRPVNLSQCRLDPDLLVPYAMELAYREANGEAILSLGDRRLVSATCWWDPSYGAPDRGDASVIAAVFTDDEGNYRLHALRYLQHDPRLAAQVDAATQLCRQVAGFVSEFHLPSVNIETNGLGRFLPGLLRQQLAAAQLACAVIERVSTRAKDLRISDAFDAVLAARRLHAHEAVWETPFIREMRDWQPGGRARDDGLDAVAGCLLSEPVRLPRVPLSARAAAAGPGRWRAAHLGVAADSAFDV